MLIAVGGHSRSVGKTSVVVGIIAATADARWCAIKITQHGHNVCSANGEPCDCAPADPSHPYALDEQIEADRTDSGRYLAAGAARSYWLRTAAGDLGHALPALKELIAASPHTIVESNSILRFMRPDLYIAVLDFSVADMKDSARLYLDRADAYVVTRRAGAGVPWQGIPARWFHAKRVFEAAPPAYAGAELTGWIQSRLAMAPNLTGA